DGIRDRNVTGVQTCALPILFYTLSSNVLLPNVGRVLKLKPDELADVVFLWLSCPESYFRRQAAVKARAGSCGFSRRLLGKILCRSEERRVGREGRSGSRRGQ